ncbi:MAG: hypothetical protein WD029_04195 [Microthrixaceae bacterium]
MSTAASDPLAWACEYRSGTAQELHQDQMLSEGRAVRLNSVTRPALVLGSAQPATYAWAEFAAHAGFDLAKRNSGGGAVWLAPGEQCWVDLWLPAGDPLWREDVSQSSWWLGESWAKALAELAPLPVSVGEPSPQVHRGPMVNRELGQIACFAGLGPGEVSLNHRKLVGISQRRSRFGARFQCVVYTTWNPEPLLMLLQSEALPASLPPDNFGADYRRNPQLSGAKAASAGSSLQAALRNKVDVIRGSQPAPQDLLEKQVFDALRIHLPVE